MKKHLKLDKCPFCERNLTHNGHYCDLCGVLTIEHLSPNFFDNKTTALCGIKVRRGDNNGQKEKSI